MKTPSAFSLRLWSDKNVKFVTCIKAAPAERSPLDKL